MRHPFLPNRGVSLRGFTLVELLVVIAIIGTLVALLLPAVQSARESARNNTCKNSLKNLSLGMLNYDSNQGQLPGYINDLVNPNNPTEGRQASWVVMLFPYIERTNEWDVWNSNLGATWMPNGIPNDAAPEIELLECPSNPVEVPGDPWCVYVVNAGQMFSDTSRSSNRENVANGIFFDRSKNVDIIGSGSQDGREGDPELKCSVDYVSSNDGTSNTMMLSESLHKIYWTYPQPDSKGKAAEYADAKRFFGFMWTNTGAEDGCGDDVLRVNGDNNYDLVPDEFNPYVGDPATAMQRTSECLSYPSSNHPGGVNVAFCDGRVVYVTDRVEPQIYAQLMTSSARRSSYVAPDGTADRRLPPVSDDDY